MSLECSVTLQLSILCVAKFGYTQTSLTWQFSVRMSLSHECTEIRVLTFVRTPTRHEAKHGLVRSQSAASWATSELSQTTRKTKRKLSNDKIETFTAICRSSKCQSPSACMLARTRRTPWLSGGPPGASDGP